MLHDIRYAFRVLLKTPSFTAIAVFTLALGIAGNVVVFSIFNGLFLRPLPFKEPERLVNLDEVAPKWNLEYTGIALSRRRCSLRSGRCSRSAIPIFRFSKSAQWPNA